MRPDQKQRIREIFLAACEKPPEQRADFVRRASGDDELVRHEVESLLTNDTEADAFLQTPALGATFGKAHPASLLARQAVARKRGPADTATPPRPTDRRMPERIGQYRILDLLGEGGMGTVYRAEQERPRRVVALKVIRSGVDSREMLQRFEHEGQVLGRLQHPGIAQIYEAGTTDAGRGPQPFFAMEFVRGRSLMDFVEHRGLSLAQRLDLFARICDAVQHAHENSVVHRDLKPGNILVDDSGQPKVLDFGVARVTNADIRTTTLHTAAGQLVGTLAYMSPEQVAGDSSRIDARSDVYALGVLLYEMLSGRVPFDVSRQTIPQAARMIAEDEPTALSSIHRAYRGDIETIVAKSLEKDEARRYESAAALATDVRRYLSQEPIAARPASAFYQLRKFAGRNRALVAGVVATMVMLVIAVVGTSYGLVQANAQRRQAESDRNRAREAEMLAEQRRRQAEASALQAAREAAKTKAVLDFLTNDLLGAADPRRTTNRETTVKEVLDAASAKIEGRFADEPLTEATIRMTLGATYQLLGEYGPAETHLVRALELHRAELTEDDPALLESIGALAELHRHQSRFEEAEGLLADAVRLARRLQGDENPNTIARRNDLALLYRDMGRFEDAQRELTEVYQSSLRALGPEDELTLVAMTNLAKANRSIGRYEEAEALFRDALAAKRRVLGDRHPYTLACLASLAVLLDEQRRFDEAEPLLVEAVVGYRQTLGEEHSYTLRTAHALALLYRDQHRYEQAEPLLLQTLDAQRRTLGDDHNDTLTSMTTLGALCQDQGRLVEAEALLTEALERRRRTLGAEHPSTLMSMHYVASLMHEQRRYAEAADLLVETLAGRRTTLGDDHPYTIAAMGSLAKTYGELGRCADAEALVGEIVARLNEREPNAPPTTVAKALCLQGTIRSKCAMAFEAEAPLRECLRIQREELPADDLNTAMTESTLGACLTALGKYDEAEPLLVGSFPRIASDGDAAATRESGQRIIEFYQVTNRPELVLSWRDRLREFVSVDSLADSEP